jgi:hypothetical protein
MCKILVQNSELLGLEALFDYFPSPYGRGWMCNRNAWSKYKKKTISGAPRGDWLHVELSPEMADSPAKVREAFAQIVLPAVVNRSLSQGNLTYNHWDWNVCRHTNSFEIGYFIREVRRH